jgi:hypothetical protein
VASEAFGRSEGQKFRTGLSRCDSISVIRISDFGFVSDFRKDAEQQASASGGVVMLRASDFEA